MGEKERRKQKTTKGRFLFAVNPVPENIKRFA